MSELHTKKVKAKNMRRRRAHMRVRNRVHGTAQRPRLAVFKSLRYVYAQVIDDVNGVTLAQANSQEKDLQSGLEASAGGREAAKAVGEAVAERAKAKGIEQVVFDRGGFVYHGKVKALAEGARSKGLQF
ncbi:MAG: 50S ribosomal protein L18 [Acidobacteriota bacterium]